MIFVLLVSNCSLQVYKKNEILTIQPAWLDGETMEGLKQAPGALNRKQKQTGSDGAKLHMETQI